MSLGKIPSSKSFNTLRVLIPSIIGILVMVSLYQILPPEGPKVTEVIETTTTLFEPIKDESIEDVRAELEETTTTVSTTTTTEETSTTSTTIPPGDPLCEELGCPYGTNFVGSKNSDLYHYCHCSYAKRIKEDNLVCFVSEEEAIEEGYTQSSCEQTTTTTSTTTTSSTTSSTTIETTTSTTVTTTSLTITTSSTTTTTSIVPTPEHVVFSEVFYDEPGRETTKEWIELYNPTSDSVDLSGLTIEDNAKSYSIPNETTILPSKFLVMARDETAFYELYGFYPDIGDFTLSLNNDGDQLTLKNYSSSEIDFVVWEKGHQDAYPSWDVKAEESESIKRSSPTQDTDTVNDWIGHAVPNPGI